MQRLHQSVVSSSREEVGSLPRRTINGAARRTDGRTEEEKRVCGENAERNSCFPQSETVVAWESPGRAGTTRPSDSPCPAGKPATPSGTPIDPLAIHSGAWLVTLESHFMSVSGARTHKAGLHRPSRSTTDRKEGSTILVLQLFPPLLRLYTPRVDRSTFH